MSEDLRKKLPEPNITTSTVVKLKSLTFFRNQNNKIKKSGKKPSSLDLGRISNTKSANLHSPLPSSKSTTPFSIKPSNSESDAKFYLKKALDEYNQGKGILEICQTKVVQNTVIPKTPIQCVTTTTSTTARIVTPVNSKFKEFGIPVFFEDSHKSEILSPVNGLHEYSIRLNQFLTQQDESSRASISASHAYFDLCHDDTLQVLVKPVEVINASFQTESCDSKSSNQQYTNTPKSPEINPQLHLPSPMNFSSVPELFVPPQLNSNFNIKHSANPETPSSILTPTLTFSPTFNFSNFNQQIEYFSNNKQINQPSPNSFLGLFERYMFPLSPISNTDSHSMSASSSTPPSSSPSSSSSMIPVSSLVPVPMSLMVYQPHIGQSMPYYYHHATNIPPSMNSPFPLPNCNIHNHQLKDSNVQIQLLEEPPIKQEHIEDGSEFFPTKRFRNRAWTNPDIQSKKYSHVQLMAFDPVRYAKAQTGKKGKFYCTHCDTKYRTILELCHHMDTEGVNRQYHCPHSDCPWFVCGFPTTSEWSRHTKSQHGEPENILKCTICEKSFARKDSLKRHYVLVHDNAKSRYNKKMRSLPK